MSTSKTTSSGTKAGTIKTRSARTPSPATQGAELDSGVTAENLASILDRLTTRPAGTLLPGLLNLNTASVTALAAIPGINAAAAQQIVQLRGNLDQQVKATTAWLVSQHVVDETTYKRIAPKLTARGYQFHLRCVGFGWPSGRYRMIEAVIDAAPATAPTAGTVTGLNTGFPSDASSSSSLPTLGSTPVTTNSNLNPRVVYLRDVTRPGLPFALDGDQLGTAATTSH